jgi:2,4-dienoyl-CoA reductase-like NADH-dependent reductase (Old Yellow Enzyme family)
MVHLEILVQMTKFINLFKPISVGATIIKNRIVSTGHDTVMAHDGHVTDRLIAYHEARAKGGAGLIIVQVSGIPETCRSGSCAWNKNIWAIVSSRARNHGNARRHVACRLRTIRRSEFPFSRDAGAVIASDD